MGPGSDSPRDSAADATADSTLEYRERLSTPLWWYPVAVGVACLLAAEFHFGKLNASAWVPFCVLIPLAIALVWWSGRSSLEITDGELRIHGAHLPLRFVSGAVGLDARTLRLVVGREGDPAAFVQIRPWVGPGVQLWLDDDDDPTPYWVVSSRHPDRLLKVLGAAR